jgi:hypothetical protein
MRDARNRSRLGWAALALQFAGLASDGLWHGLLRPGVEPTTFTGMLVHLNTVHLRCTSASSSVLISTGWAFVERRSGSSIAFAGALLSAAAEAWHASVHLRLNTRGRPIAEGAAMIGFVVVVIAAVWIGGRLDRGTGRPADDAPRGMESGSRKGRSALTLTCVERPRRAAWSRCHETLPVFATTLLPSRTTPVYPDQLQSRLSKSSWFSSSSTSVGVLWQSLLIRGSRVRSPDGSPIHVVVRRVRRIGVMR